MHFYVLSTRRIIGMPSNGCAFELENLLVDTCGARLVAPFFPEKSSRLTLSPIVSLEGSSEDRVLLVVALWTDLAEALNVFPRWRQDFRVVAAYILDPWGAWSHWPRHVPKHLDRFFVPDPRVAEQFRRVHNVSAQHVPMAADVLRYGSNSVDRPLDLLAYGRQHPAYLDVFKEAFNDPRSGRFMYHDILAGTKVTNFRDNRRLIWKLLHKSRCALAFDTLATPDTRKGDRHRSVIPIRYYEAIAAGAAIVGIRPIVPEMDVEFNWPDATIELPDSPSEALGFLEALLEDRTRLEAIHRRNHAEAWRRHDWRYRIRDILQFLDLPRPQGLTVELSRLNGPPVGCEEVPQ